MLGLAETSNLPLQHVKQPNLPLFDIPPEDTPQESPTFSSGNGTCNLRKSSRLSSTQTLDYSNSSRIRFSPSSPNLATPSSSQPQNCQHQMGIQAQRYHSASSKASLVACGFTQVPGEDYNDTYAPVVKASSIRTISALAAQEALLAIHIDVETAFLNGDLEENIPDEIPPGFVFPPEFTLPEGLTIDDFVLQL
jgi:hypothetical protein